MIPSTLNEKILLSTRTRGLRVALEPADGAEEARRKRESAATYYLPKYIGLSK